MFPDQYPIPEVSGFEILTRQPTEFISSRLENFRRFRRNFSYLKVSAEIVFWPKDLVVLGIYVESVGSPCVGCSLPSMYKRPYQENAVDQNKFVCSF